MIAVIKSAKEGSNLPEASGLCFFRDVTRLLYDPNNRSRRTGNWQREKKKKCRDHSLKGFGIGQLLSENNARENDYVLDPLMNPEQFQIL